MSFFERYFAALDGPEPLTSLELVSATWWRGRRLEF
jgi:hypothetical protein